MSIAVMKLKSYSTTSLILGLLFVTNIQAATINFEDQFTQGDGLLNPGDIITGMTLFGATFNVVNQGNAGNRNNGANPGFNLPIGGASGSRELMLFNANCGISAYPNCSGQDPDLSLPGAGNILIISEDNNSNDPDDSRFGGDIIIDFTEGATYVESIFLDVEDGRFGDNFVNAYYEGNLLASIIISSQNGGIANASFAGLGLIDQLIVNFQGSGAIVEFNYSPVPIPAAIWLFASCLLGLAFQSRSSLISIN